MSVEGSCGPLDIMAEESRDCWSDGLNTFAVENDIVEEVTEEHEEELIGCVAYAVGKTILEGEAEKYYDNQDPLAAAEFAIDGVVDCLTKVCDCGY